MLTQVNFIAFLLMTHYDCLILIQQLNDLGRRDAVDIVSRVAAIWFILNPPSPGLPN